MHLRLNYKNRIIIRESKTAEKITQKSLIDSKSMAKNKQKINMKESPQNQVNFSHFIDFHILYAVFEIYILTGILYFTNQYKIKVFYEAS